MAKQYHSCRLTDNFRKTVLISPVVNKHVSNRKKYLFIRVFFHSVPHTNLLINIFSGVKIAYLTQVKLKQFYKNCQSVSNYVIRYVAKYNVLRSNYDTLYYLLYIAIP